MSKITVNFKNLCAFFTKNLNNELMVGLLDLADFYDVQEQDFHYPKITIETEKKVLNPNGEWVVVPQCWTYEGFQRPKGNCVPVEGTDQTMQLHLQHTDHIFGTILLEIPGVAPGLSKELSAAKIEELTIGENQKRLDTAKRNKRKLKEEDHVKVDIFDRAVDIQEEIYEGRQLRANPLLCKARFYFRHGTLFSIFPEDPPLIRFTPAGSGAPDDVYPIETGLEIEVPENSYAVLRFLNSDARDFVFLGGAGQSYYVTIENSPLKHDHEADREGDEDDHEEDGEGDEKEVEQTNHFQFYYKLLKTDQPLEPMFLPIEFPRRPPSAGNPFCIPGGFGGDPPPPLE